jgi:hypothetical protein
LFKHLIIKFALITCFIGAGMYKYIGNEDSMSALKHTDNDNPLRSFSKNLKPDIKTRRIFKLCNPPEEITIGNEGNCVCCVFIIN